MVVAETCTSGRDVGEEAAQESLKAKGTDIKKVPLYSGHTVFCHIYVTHACTSLFSERKKLALDRINIHMSSFILSTNNHRMSTTCRAFYQALLCKRKQTNTCVCVRERESTDSSSTL